MLNTLNAPQREAVKYLDGPLLVLAGAGSGLVGTATGLAHAIAVWQCVGTAAQPAPCGTNAMGPGCSRQRTCRHGAGWHGAPAGRCSERHWRRYRFDASGHRARASDCGAVHGF